MGISILSSGCYYIVRNHVNPPGSETCTEMCNNYIINIARSPNNGNGIGPPNLAGLFFQCYQPSNCPCYTSPCHFLCGFAGGCGSLYGCTFPDDENGLMVSLDGVNIEPTLFYIMNAYNMNAECDSEYFTVLQLLFTSLK